MQIGETVPNRHYEKSADPADWPNSKLPTVFQHTCGKALENEIDMYAKQEETRRMEQKIYRKFPEFLRARNI